MRGLGCLLVDEKDGLAEDLAASEGVEGGGGLTPARLEADPGVELSPPDEGGEEPEIGAEGLAALVDEERVETAARRLTKIA